MKDAEATPDQRLVSALNDLAGWFRGQKRYTDAEKIYRRVLELQTNRMGRHHDVALTHNDLGVIYAESDRAGEAEAQLKEAIEMWRTLWDMELRTEDEAVTMHNYAELLTKTGRGTEAREIEAKADAIMEARKKALVLG